MKHKLVLVESPFAFKHADKGERSLGLLRNVTYARAALANCFTRSELPWCSHLLYTQPGVLDDDIPEERELGIEAGLQWGKFASMSAFYTDLGMSGGMQYGLKNARAAGRECDLNRTISGWEYASEESPSQTLFRLDILTEQEIEDILTGRRDMSLSDIMRP